MNEPIDPNDEIIHALTPSDYEKLYEEQRVETERLQGLLAISRIGNAQTNHKPSVKPVVTAERARAVLGPVGFLNTGRDDRLRAVQVDPASITDEGLRKLFGRGADFKAAQDLQRSNPGRYAALREGAKILNLYCA
jgi:hypothetical protein